MRYKERNIALLTLITPAVVPKWCTLFEIIFWNNFAGLNICCAPLNAAHFEGRWVWLSFNINFYKDWTPPASPSVHHCLYHIWCTHGLGWLGLTCVLVVIHRWVLNQWAMTALMEEWFAQMREVLSLLYSTVSGAKEILQFSAQCKI